MIAMTAPHSAAAEAGYQILESGGTAIEAMVAAAATIAVVYPHMNGLGGDGFWLISEPGKTPVAIDASGCAAQLASADFYGSADSIPARGGKAALTMAGAVSGWDLALQLSHQRQSAIPLTTLFDNAIQHARNGIEVTQSLQDASQKTLQEFAEFTAFEVFRNTSGANESQALVKGQRLKLDKLGQTLAHLADAGLNDFYQGDIGRNLAADLSQSGSPLRIQDFERYQAKQVTPLRLDISAGALFNLPEPTQGLASLMILGLYDRLRSKVHNEADFVHLFIECTKRAFIDRNKHITDSARLSTPLTDFLQDTYLDKLAASIDMQSALPWPHVAKPGDTVWMGACDSQGRMVSYIQSLYWEFGSGIVAPSTGIVWNNRGTSFSLDPSSNQYLQPGLKPFHTLNPAYAELQDGSRMVYGTMGGEGQPQTQGTLFCRHIYQKDTLAQAIAKPRWLLGRTWGDVSHNLKIEDNTDSAVTDKLRSLGHDIALIAENAEMMGHAGAIRLFPNSIDAASDPRSDGQAIRKGINQ
ncbi:MAG: gamma-glutamyltransferase family protein [Aestuariibacter sp.]